MNEEQMASLIASRDAERILRQLIDQDERTGLLIVCALGLSDTFRCGKGLLLYDHGPSAKLQRDGFSLHGVLRGPFCCNVCGYSPNLDVQYLQNRLDNGELGRPPASGESGFEGLQIAQQRLAFLEGRVTYDTRSVAELRALLEDTPKEDEVETILAALAATGEEEALRVLVGRLPTIYTKEQEQVRALLREFPEAESLLVQWMQEDNAEVHALSEALILIRELDTVDARRLPTTKPVDVAPKRQFLFFKRRSRKTTVESLFRAIAEDDARGVKRAHRGGADPNAVLEGDHWMLFMNHWVRPIEGDSALMCAIEAEATRGQFGLQIVELLLAQGADPNFTSRVAITPIHRATHRGDMRAVDILIGCGAEVNVADWNGRTPLHWVCRCTTARLSEPPMEWFAQCTKRLIAAGADPNAGDKIGRTPLHEAAAASCGNEDVIQALLQGGADTHCRDKLGLRPVQLVRADHGHTEGAEAKRAMLK